MFCLCSGRRRELSAASSVEHAAPPAPFNCRAGMLLREGKVWGGQGAGLGWRPRSGHSEHTVASWGCSRGRAVTAADCHVSEILPALKAPAWALHVQLAAASAPSVVLMPLGMRMRSWVGYVLFLQIIPE